MADCDLLAQADGVADARSPEWPEHGRPGHKLLRPKWLVRRADRLEAASGEARPVERQVRHGARSVVSSHRVRETDLAMRIDNVTVKNFRNLAKIEVPLQPGTVLVGENRVGKS